MWWKGQRKKLSAFCCGYQLQSSGGIFSDGIYSAHHEDDDDADDDADDDDLDEYVNDDNDVDEEGLL